MPNVYAARRQKDALLVLFFRFLMPAWLVLATGALGFAQAALPTITFDNRSGEPVLIGLIGPKIQIIMIPSEQRSIVTTAEGQYHILTRYGGSPEDYRYMKREPFILTPKGFYFSGPRITLPSQVTLFPVPRGKYNAQSITAEEFDTATVCAQASGPARTGRTVGAAESKGYLKVCDAAPKGVREGITRAADAIGVSEIAPSLPH